METIAASKQPQRLQKPVRISEQKWPEGTQPVVSIFCITYNHEKFIREAIEGFLMQETTFPVEIFIHDDASNDTTPAIVREYARKYPHLFWTVCQEENQWAKGGRKFLCEYLARQRGDFIAFCEGDDFWVDRQKLQQQYELIAARPESMMVGAYATAIDERNGGKIVSNQPIGPLARKKEYELGDMLEQGFMMNTYFMRRELALLPSWVEKEKIINVDLVLLLLAAAKGPILFLDRVVAIYRWHAGGVWAGARASKKVRHALFVYQRIDRHLRHRFKSLFLRAQLNLVRCVVRQLVAEHRWREALVTWAGAIRFLFPKGLWRMAGIGLLAPVTPLLPSIHKITMKLALRSRLQKFR